MKLNSITGLALLFSLSWTALPQASEVETLLLDPVDSVRDRIVPLKIYHVPSKTPQPVVLFSHGLGGSREGNPYLGNHWAEHGYVAIFLQHAGSDREVWASVPRAERMAALKSAAGAQALRDRLADVPFVLDQLETWNEEEAHPLQGKLDLDQIGLAGHSFGAVTTLGLTGRKYPAPRTFRDERIDAFLPMSPQPGKGLAPSQAFGHLEMPIFCMTGTEDGSPLDPTLNPETRQEVYTALPPGDKFQLVLEGAHHHAFGDGLGGRRTRQRNPNHHPTILTLSTRFWDAYLRNDSEAKAWLQSEAPRESCKLDPKDVWQWK